MVSSSPADMSRLATRTHFPSMSSSSFMGATFGSQSLFMHDCNAKNPVPSHGASYAASRASSSGPVTADADAFSSVPSSSASISRK